MIRWAFARVGGRIDILLIWRLIESGTGDTIVNDLKRISQPIDVRLLACKEREVREDSFPKCGVNSFVPSAPILFLSKRSEVREDSFPNCGANVFIPSSSILL